MAEDLDAGTEEGEMGDGAEQMQELESELTAGAGEGGEQATPETGDAESELSPEAGGEDVMFLAKQREAAGRVREQSEQNVDKQQRAMHDHLGEQAGGVNVNEAARKEEAVRARQQMSEIIHEHASGPEGSLMAELSRSVSDEMKRDVVDADATGALDRYLEQHGSSLSEQQLREVEDAMRLATLYGTAKMMGHRSPAQLEHAMGRHVELAKHHPDYDLDRAGLAEVVAGTEMVTAATRLDLKTKPNLQYAAPELTPARAAYSRVLDMASEAAGSHAAHNYEIEPRAETVSQVRAELTDAHESAAIENEATHTEQAKPVTDGGEAAIAALAAESVVASDEPVGAESADEPVGAESPDGDGVSSPYGNREVRSPYQTARPEKPGAEAEPDTADESAEGDESAESDELAESDDTKVEPAGETPKYGNREVDSPYGNRDVESAFQTKREAKTEDADVDRVNRPDVLPYNPYPGGEKAEDVDARRVDMRQALEVAHEVDRDHERRQRVESEQRRYDQLAMEAKDKEARGEAFEVDGKKVGSETLLAQAEEAAAHAERIAASIKRREQGISEQHTEREEAMAKQTDEIMDKVSEKLGKAKGMHGHEGLQAASVAIEVPDEIAEQMTAVQRQEAQERLRDSVLTELGALRTSASGNREVDLIGQEVIKTGEKGRGRVLQRRYTSPDHKNVLIVEDIDMKTGLTLGMEVETFTDSVMDKKNKKLKRAVSGHAKDATVARLEKGGKSVTHMSGLELAKGYGGDYDGLRRTHNDLRGKRAPRFKKTTFQKMMGRFAGPQPK